MTKAEKKKKAWANIIHTLNQYRLPEAANLIRLFDSEYMNPPRKTRIPGKRKTS